MRVPIRDKGTRVFERDSTCVAFCFCTPVGSTCSRLDQQQKQDKGLLTPTKNKTRYTYARQSSAVRVCVGDFSPSFCCSVFNFFSPQGSVAHVEKGAVAATSRIQSLASPWLSIHISSSCKARPSHPHALETLPILPHTGWRHYILSPRIAVFSGAGSLGATPHVATTTTR